MGLNKKKLSLLLQATGTMALKTTVQEKKQLLKENSSCENLFAKLTASSEPAQQQINLAYLLVYLGDEKEVIRYICTQLERSQLNTSALQDIFAYTFQLQAIKNYSDDTLNAVLVENPSSSPLKKNSSIKISRRAEQLLLVKQEQEGDAYLSPLKYLLENEYFIKNEKIQPVVAAIVNEAITKSQPMVNNHLSPIMMHYVNNNYRHQLAKETVLKVAQTSVQATVKLLSPGWKSIWHYYGTGKPAPSQQLQAEDIVALIKKHPCEKVLHYALEKPRWYEFHRYHGKQLTVKDWASLIVFFEDEYPTITDSLHTTQLLQGPAAIAKVRNALAQYAKSISASKVENFKNEVEEEVKKLQQSRTKENKKTDQLDSADSHSKNEETNQIPQNSSVVSLSEQDESSVSSSSTRNDNKEIEQQPNTSQHIEIEQTQTNPQPQQETSAAHSATDSHPSLYVEVGLPGEQKEVNASLLQLVSPPRQQETVQAIDQQGSDRLLISLDESQDGSNNSEYLVAFATPVKGNGQDPDDSLLAAITPPPSNANAARSTNSNKKTSSPRFHQPSPSQSLMMTLDLTPPSASLRTALKNTPKQESPKTRNGVFFSSPNPSRAAKKINSPLCSPISALNCNISAIDLSEREETISKNRRVAALDLSASEEAIQQNKDSNSMLTN